MFFEDCADDGELRILKAHALGILGQEFISASRVRRAAGGSDDEAYNDATEIHEKVKEALVKSIQVSGDDEI